MYFFWFLGSFSLTLLILFMIFSSGGAAFFEIYLFSFGNYDLIFSFLLDQVSLGFFWGVSFISGLVFFYSVFYMSGTVDYRRFRWLLFGFVLSMGFLVFSGNFLVTMVGWDGLGLISFCLVIFYSNHSSLDSGLITVFSNRVGDVFFLSCFFFYFMGGGIFSSDISSLHESLFFWGMMFLGAITKSAQTPFSAWLPAAMAAPTPVSSLVHSSTLVTAGVYVLIRYFYLFVFYKYVFFKIFFLCTMLIAGLSSVLENDFKKVVAMSTLSQLGLMMYIISVGVWSLAFLHMVIHAFFKSMLFLSTGSMMSHYSGGQDSRFYGGNGSAFSSFLFFLVSCFCLMGFPFYIGFYSKDFILLGSSSGSGVVYYSFFMSGCVLTVVYSFRLISMSFSGILKSASYLNYEEKFFYSFCVFFLFFMGWGGAALFYWFFLYGSLVVFSGFDVILGFFVIFTGAIVFKVLFLLYDFSFWVFSISFVRWIYSSGVTFSSLKISFSKWDSSWLELLGGQGAYRLFFFCFSLLAGFYTLMLGFLLVVSMFLIFFFIW